ncbi:MAG: alpha/beta hydrolase-fold protein [Pirellulaceae bacterium]|nr:alpha/beta hydrolase-fold protein [Pirellulaceae bacterium]MDP6556764.1 alpha/beta hydrolase-fold protein [Pirellulaceae bacterium]
MVSHSIRCADRAIGGLGGIASRSSGLNRNNVLRVLAVGLVFFGPIQGGATSTAAVVTMKSGMQFQGKVTKIGSLNDNPLNPNRTVGAVDVKPIVILDDELRWVFVPNQQVASFADSPAAGYEKIGIDQRVATAGKRISSVGPIIRITGFDEWGRRVYSMQSNRGQLDVVQGITLITPTYTKVQGLLIKNPLVWDMRIATSSIPRDVLSTVLRRQIDDKDPDGRLRIVRLYIQAERYGDALEELNHVIKDFPDLSHLKDQAARLQQLLAQELLREIDVRQDAGQHARVNALLSRFPSDGVAGETLLKVRDRILEYEKRKGQYDQILEMLGQHISEIKDEAAKMPLDAIYAEIKLELSIHTLSRMASYLRLADDATLTVDQKVALGVSGWLLGGADALDNLAVGLSLIEARNETTKYLQATRKHERELILDKIKTLEGGAPKYLALLIANMKPPVVTLPQNETDVVADKETPGFFEITIPGIEDQASFKYHVQLPPEYHPLHRYPCIVTLNGAGTTAAQQVSWWAGDFDKNSLMRRGQASRQGYIVVSPHWTKPYQRKYEFSPREHAAVLYSLRDACRRFAINTDKVFLSGHSMGGDAAWDIGVSHPDLWAGVIPIVANSAKYVNRYTENARGLPLYFVGGEKDGGWLHDNGIEFDRYMRHSGYDCTIVQYRGRGHESFQDEIQHIFDWMNVPARTRNFYPREVEVVSMRPWDNYFWWLELDDFPVNAMVVPAQWPPVRGTRPIQTSGRILENNRITIRTGAQKAIVWLTPEMLSFDRRITVTVNGRDIREDVKPDAEVLLEDVRTRGDRQHPFWANVNWRGRGR